MRRSLGVLAEAYSKWERRAPLTPSHVSRLVNSGVEVLVQPSSKRVFTDREFAAAGATITRDLSGANTIMGVKQPLNGSLLPGKNYLFFSHVIKAQPENMPLLDEVLEKKVRLIDYECIREGGGGTTPRLVAFGEFAGMSGMVNGLRGLGLRLLSLGHSTPFLSIGPTHAYTDYSTDARRALRAAGEQVARAGLPAEYSPLVVCVAGTGNVSRGALDALDSLGEVVERVAPSELARLSALAGTAGEHQHKVYVCVTGAQDFVRPARPGAAFDRAEYYASPTCYVPCFHETIAPHVSLLVPTMYWDRRFPRLLSTDQLQSLRASGNKRLLAVADLTCDVDGAVEPLVRSTTIDEPFFHVRRVHDTSAARPSGVDILPAELPREASAHFAQARSPRPSTRPPHSEGHTARRAPLSAELSAATIAEAGALAPAYGYIGALREARERDEESQRALSGRDAALRHHLSEAEARALGHLFDSGLINAALDVVTVRPNESTGREPASSLRQKSSALMQLTLDAGRAPLDAVLSQLQALAARMPLAEASVVELPEHCGGVYDRTIPGSAGGGAAALAASAAAAPAPGGSRIVVLGAGLCALPAIELLSRRSADVVTVISAVEGEASRACAALGRPNLQPLTVDARPTNASGWGALCGLLGQADACLSLLPATMHAPVAEACIEGGTPLASYVSEELLALHERAVAAGVPLLGEMGLDPGARLPEITRDYPRWGSTRARAPRLDHMSAAELIRRVREEGGAVTAFSSLCGGLPAPECASSTPLAYKFSWSPAGVISATRNPAQFTVDGAVVRVAGEELLRSATPLADSSRLGRTLRLEVLPNRDSLPYAELYGIEAEAHSVFRGTLRYAGWSGLFAEFADLGL
ncbi:Saccharopine dehydrogenase, partial [Emiliania huxleyi CCMP1516]|uniref:Saccharopine dehydrogenase (NAD(+), L-glutamate-forming) n=2 Tax=Emiliania huxleyi TaxID=2903 RepID=A0A0D3JF17_EMIH1